MITLEQAKSIAERHLLGTTRGSASPVVILDACTEERADGWLFHYNTEAYIRTGRAEDTLLGAPPLLVDRHTGAVREVPRPIPRWTAEEVEEAIARHARKRSEEENGS